MVKFGTETTVSSDVETFPRRYHAAIRQVREHLDRDVLYEAIDRVEDVTFIGVATYRRRIDYDWQRLPAFVGLDVWFEEKGAFRPPDAVEGIYDRLGIEPVNAIDREVRVRDFDLDRQSFPPSSWYDGPVTGLLIKNKRGGRGRLHNPAIDEELSTDSTNQSPEAIVDDYPVHELFKRVKSDLEGVEKPIRVGTIVKRSMEVLYREQHHRLGRAKSRVDPEELRSTLAHEASRFISL